MISKAELEQRIKASLLDELQKSSIDDITVVLIAQKCNISRTTFYSYYDSVYAVMQDIEDNYLDAFTEKMLKAVYNSYYKSENRASIFADVFIEDTDENNLILRTMLGPHGDENFEAKLKKRLKELYMFNVNADSGKQLTPLQHDIILEYRVGGKIAAMKWFANNYSPEKAKKQLEEFYALTIKIDDYIDGFYK